MKIYKICPVCKGIIEDEYVQTYYFERHSKKYLLHNECADKILYKEILATKGHSMHDIVEVDNSPVIY